MPNAVSLMVECPQRDAMHAKLEGMHNRVDDLRQRIMRLNARRHKVTHTVLVAGAMRAVPFTTDDSWLA